MMLCSSAQAVPSLPANNDATLSLSGLLQELLMALLGYAGDVFVDTNQSLDWHQAAGQPQQLQPPSAVSIRLAEDIDWVDSRDRALFNEVAALGFHYQQLQQWVSWETWGASDSAGTLRGSAYRQALAAGIEEVLGAFQKAVVALEQLLLEDASCGLPGVQYQLASWQVLLPQLHQLVWRVSDPALPQPLSGGALLRTLTAAASNGQPLLQACFERLLWHCRQVLFQQLTAWMVHGMLSDAYGEFFIQPAHSLPPHRPDGADWTPEELTYHDWHAAFGVNASALPPGIDEQLAHAIEFIGKAVRLLRAPPADKLVADGAAAAAAAKLARLQLRSTHQASEGTVAGPAVAGAGGSPPRHVRRSTNSMRGRTTTARRSSCGPPSQPPDPTASGGWAAAAAEAARAQVWADQLEQQLPVWWELSGSQGPLLPYEDTLEFCQALSVLQQAPEANQVALERTVEAIRADVAARLWQLLVVRAGLMQHFEAVKHYLLLARGDFWDVFLGEASRLLALPPRPATANSDIAVPFQAAAGKTSAAEDPYFKLFKIHFSDQPLKVRKNAPGMLAYLDVPEFDAGWDHLWLEAQLPWPLGLLLTPKHLDRYNALFQFLLRLKRVQMHLEQAWQQLGRLCRSGSPGSSACSPGVSALLQLRQHMAHLVTNLQIYLQLDVIDTNFSRLQQAIAQAQDFSAAEAAHDAFLHTLVTQSFLSHSSLTRQFGEVFAQVRTLCALVATASASSSSSGGVRVEREAVQAVASQFNATVSALYISLQSKTLQQYDQAPYLRQLCLRLDFNSYIEQRRMNFFTAARGTQRHQRLGQGPS